MLNRESTGASGSGAAAQIPAMRQGRQPSKIVMDLGKAITLIPFSGIQFIDFEFSAVELSHLRRRFFEQPAAPEADFQPILHPIIMEDGVLRDPHTQAVLPSDETISVSGVKSVEAFLDAWLPLPLMRVISPENTGTQEDAARQLDEGPINWARVHISAADRDQDGQAVSYRVVIAIDTGLETQGRHEGDPYLAPTSVDVALSSRFCFSDQVDDVAWFVSEPWVDAWVQDLYQASRAPDHASAPPPNQQSSAPAAPTNNDGHDTGLAHLAHYLTMLAVLSELCDLPEIGFLDTADQRQYDETVGVDLVLDYGHARSFGVLMEYQAQATTVDLQRARVLLLRDLSAPAQIHANAFPSQLEFSPAAFGNAALSRQSGRGNAFFWPSFVRVGDEAARLSRHNLNQDRATGLGQLKSHLLDRDLRSDGWFFASDKPQRPNAAQPVYGPLLKFLSETGDLLSDRDGAGSGGALRARFSHASMTSLFFCELVQQTLVQINSPFWRAHQPNITAARQLRRIVIATPNGSSMAERKALLRRAEAGVDLLWQAMGWADQGPVSAPPRPVVALGLDEAMGAQSAYLYDQIMRKFIGPVQDFVSLKGKSRAAHGARPVCKIASIDVGAGTTSLSIATYSALADKAMHQNIVLRASVPVGGEDVLRAIKDHVVIAAVEANLSQSRGAGGAHRVVLAQLLTSALDRKMADRVFDAAALAILNDYDAFSAADAPRLTQISFADLLGAQTLADFGEVLAQLDHAIAASCGGQIADPGFALQDCVICYRHEEMSALICQVLRRGLCDLSDIVQAQDCDLCLLSGRGSHIRDVLDLVAAAKPVRADKLISLGDYSPGNWYPSAGGTHLIGDAKTTAAIGALVQLLGQGNGADLRLVGDDDAADVAALADEPAAGTTSAMRRCYVEIDADGALIILDHKRSAHTILLECAPDLLPEDAIARFATRQAAANAGQARASMTGAASAAITGAASAAITGKRETLVDAPDRSMMDKNSASSTGGALPPGDAGLSAGQLHQAQEGHADKIVGGRIEVKARDLLSCDLPANAAGRDSEIEAAREAEADGETEAEPIDAQNWANRKTAGSS